MKEATFSETRERAVRTKPKVISRATDSRKAVLQAGYPVYWCLAFLLSGCAGNLFYNEVNHKAATTALEKVRVLQKEQQSSLAELQSNLALSVQSQSAALKEIVETAVVRECDAVLRMPISEAETQLTPPSDKECAPILGELNVRYANLTALVRSNLQDAKIKLPEAILNATTANTQLEAAKLQLTQWNKKVALFSKLIELLPATVALESVTTPEEKQAAFKSLSESYGSSKVEYTDADGKSQSDPISKIMSEVWDTPSTPDDKLVKEAVVNVIDASPPGALVVMANLAYDIAEVERAEAQLKVNEWTEAQAALAEGQYLIDAFKNLAKSASSTLKELDLVTNGKLSFSTYLLQQGDGLKVVAVDKEKDLEEAQVKIGKAVKNAYSVAEILVILKGPAVQAMDEMELAIHATRHRRSLSASAASIGKHRAYIERSLEVVELYHASGVKPEKVGEFAFRLAELSIFAVMLGVIP